MKNNTYGPIKSFEKRVPKNWWKTYFAETYYHSDGDVVKNEINTRREVAQFLKAVKLKKTDPIADFCCGQGRHVLELARRGFSQLVGVDASTYLLDLARKTAIEKNLNVSFIKSNVLQVKLAQKMKCIYIFGNSFGYFQSSAENLKLLKYIRQNLLPGGQVVIDMMDGDQVKENLVPFGAEWVDKNHLVCRERQVSQDGQRVLSRRIYIHTQKGVLSDDFYAIDLYSRKKIINLLKSAGFKKVHVQSVVPSQSKSHQSTGLMGYRMMVIAENG